jgi:putative cardiolipin synthase
MEAAAQAAARGVRVRMLLDDANGRKLDAVVADLLAQPNLEIRLFNPFANRSLAVFEALGDFGRLNRRMHNKALIVDNQAAIIGGRNVGDEYFGASETGFADLDVVAVGPLVREVSAEFDRYWNSASAYPALSLMAPTGGLEARRRESEARGGPAAEKYLRALRETPLVRELLAGALPLEWCAARLLADDPAKIHDAGGEKSDLLARIEEALGNPQRELNLVSPYFVPGKEGVNAFARLAARGVRVNVLTNSFAATDVSAVHAGYAKYREDMLRAGVRLFELKPDGKPLPRTQSDDKGYGAPGSQARAGSSGRACTRRPSAWIRAASSSARSTSIRARPTSTPRWAR